jgi:hypothetical protein
MSTTPLPIDQFAQKVRAAYPGVYDHLGDGDLVSKIVSKYPEYKQSIDQNIPDATAQAHASVAAPLKEKGRIASISAPGETGEPGTPSEEASNAELTATALGLGANPIATVRGIAGAAAGAGLGGYGGKEIGGIFGQPGVGEKIGSTVGGLAGGFMGARGSEVPSKGGLLRGLLFGKGKIAPPEPSPFAGATSSSTPLGSAPLPAPPTTEQPAFRLGLPEPEIPKVPSTLKEARAQGVPVAAIPTRMPKIAPPQEQPISLFGNATPSNVPIGNEPLPNPKGNPTPFPQVQSKIAPPTSGRSPIIDPNNIPADEVTHQSVPWEELKAKAIRGDKFAIDEVIRRGRESEIPGLAGVVGKAKPYPRIGRN